MSRLAAVTVPVRSVSGVFQHEVRGTAVGPFVVHQQKQLARAGGSGIWKRPGWSVTHAETGFTACPNVPNKKAAMHAADLLINLPVDWVFSDTETPKSWPAVVVARVHEIRAAARAGATP